MQDGILLSGACAAGESMFIFAPIESEKTCWQASRQS